MTLKFYFYNKCPNFHPPPLKDKPSQDFKTQNGTNIISSIKDNDSTKQLRTDLIKEKFRDKLNLLEESLYKDLKRYNRSYE